MLDIEKNNFERVIIAMRYAGHDEGDPWMRASMLALIVLLQAILKPATAG